jgi:GTP-binding protein
MSSTHRDEVRNIAIIAHVDHGKTTLVDAMLGQTGVTVKGEAPRGQALDTNELEVERGITILSKCTSIDYAGRTFNIVDTPGHADFGSEVERVLRMVDGVLLVVDAVEGPMPQTKFVLRKALERGLPPIVVINKMDRPHIRPSEVLDEVSCLLIDLGADDEQLDFPVFYAAAKRGWASPDPGKPGADLTPLFEAVLERVPPPPVEEDGGLQLQATMLDNSSYVGKIAIGRIQRGSVRIGETVVLLKPSGQSSKHKVTKLSRFTGLGQTEIREASAGDIVSLAGVETVEIGDTIASTESPEALPALTIDEPTLAMQFLVNDSPFAGKDGKFVTSRHLKSRLLEEQKTNVGLKIEELPGEGRFKVSGRGELHLSVLIEAMRREGFELAVSRPEVILKKVDGVPQEPIEALFIDVESEFQGPLFEALGQRGGKLQNMSTDSSGRLRLEYLVPARCLIGFKSDFLTMTRGTGTLYHSFHGYAPKSGEVAGRKNGVLVAKEPGTSTAYALFGLQDRAKMFVGPGVDVYPGMVVGENSRDNDLIVNPCKQKQMTNMRTKSADEALTLVPPHAMTLEQAISYIQDDELVEVTPEALRLRKKILDPHRRKRAERGSEEAAVD